METGITRTRGLFPFSLVTDHETKAPKEPCTCPQEEVINAAVKVSQKVRLPAVDLDQVRGLDLLTTKNPFYYFPTQIAKKL